MKPAKTVIWAGLALLCSSALVLATVGGPDLAEPLGYEPRTGDVFFRIISMNESGYAPSVLRLKGRGVNRFMPLDWSVEVSEDSMYRARLKSVTRGLRPLRERLTTTIPQLSQVVLLDTLRRHGSNWPRYRTSVRWFNGACEGRVTAETFLDPSLRMIRLYEVPASDRLIGVFSFLGLPYEIGYEVQVPILLPARDSVVVAERSWIRRNTKK